MFKKRPKVLVSSKSFRRETVSSYNVDCIIARSSGGTMSLVGRRFQDTIPIVAPKCDFLHNKREHDGE